MSVLSLNNVRKVFGRHVAVDDLTLDVPAGCVYGFIGPNGAGKTTTLRMIVDIIRPDSGMISVLGSSDPAIIRSRIGYLPEERGMYKKMRCLDFVAYVGMLKGLPRADARRRAEEIITALELGKWLNASVDALSKGMQQKLQFAATIVHTPDLLILDEPFSGLDPVNLEVLKETVLDYRREGRTVLFSTHMMDHAERLCDAIAMIHEGRKVLDGSLSAIKGAAPDRTVRLGYFGDADFVKGLPYVTRVRENRNDMEVFLAADADPEQLLRDILGRVRISRFQVTEPSLYDIFLEKVGAGRGLRFSADGHLIEAEAAR